MRVRIDQAPPSMQGPSAATPSTKFLLRKGREFDSRLSAPDWNTQGRRTLLSSDRAHFTPMLNLSCPGPEVQWSFLLLEVVEQISEPFGLKCWKGVLTQ